MVAYYEEGHARLVVMNASVAELNAELGRSLLPYWRAAYSE